MGASVSNEWFIWKLMRAQRSANIAVFASHQSDLTLLSAQTSHIFSLMISSPGKFSSSNSLLTPTPGCEVWGASVPVIIGLRQVEPLISLESFTAMRQYCSLFLVLSAISKIIRQTNFQILRILWCSRKRDRRRLPFSCLFLLANMRKVFNISKFQQWIK